MAIFEILIFPKLSGKWIPESLNLQKTHFCLNFTFWNFLEHSDFVTDISKIESLYNLKIPIFQKYIQSWQHCKKNPVWVKERKVKSCEINMSQKNSIFSNSWLCYFSRDFSFICQRKKFMASFSVWDIRRRTIGRGT